MHTLKLARMYNSLPVPQEKPQGIRRIFDNSQLIERFEAFLIAGCNVRPNTQTSYLFTARDFAKYLVDKPLTATTKDDVRGYLATLYARGMAPSTSQTRLHALRSLFNFLTLGGQTLTSVPRFIRPRKIPSRLPKALKKDELERFLGAAKEEPRDLAIAELFYAAGLRISEIAALRIEDVHFHAKRLIVRDGKGGKDRVTYFGSPAAKALRAYLGDRTSGRLFQPTPREQHGGVTSNGTSYWGQWRETDANGERIMRSARLGAFRPRKRNAMITQAVELRQAGRKWREIFAFLFPGVTLTRKEKMRFWSGTSQRLKHGKPDVPVITREAAAEEVRELCEDLPKKEAEPERGLTTRQIARIVLKIAKRAGVDDLNPHRLRHTFATDLLNAGADVMAVKELLGHESVSTTAKYLHVAISNLISTHAKFHPRG